MNIIKNIVKKINEYYPFLISGVILFTLLQRIHLLYPSDDISSGQKVIEMGALNWLKYRIFNWQPRIYSDILFSFFVRHDLIIWRIFIVSMFIIMLFMIFKISDFNIDEYKYRISVISFLSCIIFTINPHVFTSSILWFTGSFYYLCPIVTLLVSIYNVICYYNNYRINNIIIFNIINICIVLTCYTEQTAAIIFCLYSLFVIYMKICRKKISLEIYIQYILIIGNILLNIYLSTFGNRSFVEKRWYPGYDMLTTVDKLFQGINWTNFHYINSSNFIIFMLCIFSTILIINRNSKLNEKIFSFSILSFIVLRIIPLDIFFKNININNSNIKYFYPQPNEETYSVESILSNYIFDSTKVNPQNILHTSYSNLLPAFFCMFVVLCIGLLIYISFEQKKDKLLYTVLYSAAICSGYAISFSPTIFASGSRIFFVGDIIIVCIIVKLFSQLLENKFKYIFYVNYILIPISIIMYLNFLFKFTVGGVLWY